ncbi:MAG: Glu/Leu/Phe/Val dehydrogenase dimerization domain-containing protein [Azospirillaceae bacterium]
MSVFAQPDFASHEQVVFAADAATGLKAILAIHDTRRGPALGGCRYWAYGDEDAAIRDALRLSHGMTYKAAVADLPLGGGKSVILAPPGGDPGAKPDGLMAAMGRAVDRLGGRYIIAEDVGTSPADMAEIARETGHVVGLAPEDGGRGDPSPVTARGIFAGLRAAVAYRTGKDDLTGLTVAVQGLGHVGRALCGLLHEAGAGLVVTDLREAAVAEAVESLGARAADPHAILSEPVDVLAPCALGAVIDDTSVARLRAGIVAGAANNQLAEARHGLALRERGILYAPDYVLNAGGLIHVAADHFRHDADWVAGRLDGIAATLTEIFRRADRDGVATSAAADRLAEDRLREADAAALAA